ncbi:PHP domain-containing protein [Halorussus halophilus]|uniref:PHP domain-containing protein n=1 Tax=Halorussus halophilus TaxID=2650975 RepID=UPI001CE3E5A0|nr:PHP domain-containing protein [Halorussus halophilus]
MSVTQDSSVKHDYHVHSNYSDGTMMTRMVAADAGLDGIGFADHCNVSQRDWLQEGKRAHGINLDATYELRREGIELLREQYDLEIYDAVEVDYAPRDEDDIEAFLGQANFDYAIGSVHRIDGENVQRGSPYENLSERERSAVVDDYYDRLVSLVESELFDVAAHVDLVERTPELRGYSTTDHYEQVADAFARSRTVPEINAGRVLRDGVGEFHPSATFLSTLREREVEFVAGTDSHEPDQISERVSALSERFGSLETEPAQLL